jgi:hypothetical protein
VYRRVAQQGIRLVEWVQVTAVLKPLYNLTFVRDRALYMENTTLTDIYRACGAELAQDIRGDIAIPVFHTVAGSTPTFEIAKLFQEHGGILRSNQGALEFIRLPDLFNQTPKLYAPANATKEVQSDFIEKHEAPWFLSVDDDGNFVMGNNTNPRHVRYIHRADEERLRNMTRVLINYQQLRLDVNMSLCAGDLGELSDGTKTPILTVAHAYSTGTDGLEVAQYTKVWLSILIGQETGGGGTVEIPNGQGDPNAGGSGGSGGGGGGGGAPGELDPQVLNPSINEGGEPWLAYADPFTLDSSPLLLGVEPDYPIGHFVFEQSDKPTTALHARNLGMQFSEATGWKVRGMIVVHNLFGDPSYAINTQTGEVIVPIASQINTSYVEKHVNTYDVSQLLDELGIYSGYVDEMFGTPDS